MPKKQTSLAKTEQAIGERILLIRGTRVLIDADLAKIYGVPTKALNQAVKRHKERFPEDFMFQLTEKEKEEVVTNCDHLSRLKFSPVMPYAFTEHGTIMAANVLNSPRAIKTSVYVVRAFVRQRELLLAHKELASVMAELERRVDKHDETIAAIIATIRELIDPPEDPPRKRIGFRVEESKSPYRRSRKKKKTGKNYTV